MTRLECGDKFCSRVGLAHRKFDRGPQDTLAVCTVPKPIADDVVWEPSLEYTENCGQGCTATAVACLFPSLASNYNGASLVIVEKMRTMVEYLPDSSVDDALDEEIRGLLITCFTKPKDAVFKKQRYFFEPYSHRWVIRTGQGYMIAHTGVHEKEIESQGTTYRIGGLAEVCVHPDYRGKGYVRDMVQCIHQWLQHHDFPFAMLFGDPAVYVSSGYTSIDNLVHGGDQEGWQKIPGMMKELSDTTWPTGEVRLPGSVF